MIATGLSTSPLLALPVFFCLPPPPLISSTDILKSASLHRSRDRSMSLDFPPSAPQHPLYSQQDLDHPFSSLSTPGDISSAPSHQHAPSHLPMNHGLDRQDPMDVSDHPSYDIFSNNAQSSSLQNQRYRGNSSASSYGLGVDMYQTQSPFSDSIPQFHNPSPNPYDYSLPSSYSSGKPSPLTPNDSVGSLPHSSAFSFNNGHPKEYSNHGFDVDRRMSLSTGSYPSYDNEDYNGINVNNGLGLGGFSSSLPPFERGRYPPVIPPLSHLHQNHTPDLMNGVNPHAVHGFSTLR